MARKLIINAAAAIGFSMAAVNCSPPVQSENVQSSLTPVWTFDNGCGINTDVFYVKLIQSELARISDEVLLSHQLDSAEHSEEFEIQRNKLNQITKEAFEKRADREPRFSTEFELLKNPNESEECLYIKLRIAEKIIHRR